ncbi:MAG: cadherin domain-containing protein, partial [Porticoccaceae bacterium]|nr:cadherin domain-containing protein [Porticoccaceae bacterium]
YVDSGVESGDVVYTAVATDDSKLVKYRLDDASELNGLSIHGRKGDVTLSHDTHESDAPLAFTVIAKDLDGNETSHTVTLNVSAIPDTAAPVIESLSEVAITENTEDNVVYTPEATDAYGNEVTFSLGRGSDKALSIENGLVVLTESADNEGQSAYRFVLIATDSEGNRSAKKVVVNVDNADELAPVLTSDASAAVVENSGAEQVVYTATASDADHGVNNTITYSLSPDSSDGLSIDAASGEVVLAADPDSESQAGYSFTVVATDASGNASEQDVSLIVVDADDTAPEFTSGNVASIGDEAGRKGQVIYTATVDDSADVSKGRVTFELSEDSDPALVINQNTGRVRLTDAPDADAQDVYNFTVIATDGAGNTSQQAVSLTLSVYDTTAPVIAGGDEAVLDAIDENSGANQVIYTAQSDEPNTVWSLSGDSDDGLSINAAGQITLLDNPDNETGSSYNFTVIATDSAGNSSKQSLSLEINDLDEMAPFFTSGAEASIAENSGSGQVIYDGNASDSLDISGGVTYSIVTDAPDNSYTPLSIPNVQSVYVDGAPVANAGDQVEVTVDYLAESNQLTGLGLRIHFDSSSLSVSDISDVFADDLIFTNTVAEADIENLDGIASTDSFVSAGWASFAGNWTSTGLPEDLLTVVFDVAGDASGSTEIGFSAIDTAVGYGFLGVSHDLHISDLSIDQNGDVSLAANPDFEAQSSYDFTVVATDATGLTAEQDVSIAVENIDESAPVITSGDTAANIDENSGRSQIVYTAQSDDSGDVSNGPVTYTLAPGHDSTIAINAQTGEVLLLSDPDHEAQSEYSFTIIAADAAGLISASETVTLTINDLDDTSPVIASASTVNVVDENSGADQVIYTAVADDSADVNDGSMSYTLSGDSDSALNIDAASGEVTLSTNPDHEGQSEYSFTVIASDGINPSVAQSLTLNINDLDDAAPTVNSADSAGSIDENSEAGQVVYSASADDSADNVSGGVTFSLTEDSDSALSINAQSGDVTLATSPDHEAQDQYSFTVVATDAAGNASQGQSVTLDVNDLDDTAPTVTSVGTIAAVEAGSSAGEVIYTATADDSGDITNGVTFSLATARSDLSIDSATGAVTLAEAADPSGYNFTVIATDASGLSDQQDVNMAVYQTVNAGGLQSGAGDINQTITDNNDGSFTLSIEFSDSLLADGISEVGFDLNYSPEQISGGALDNYVSPLEGVNLVNEISPGSLQVTQISFEPFSSTAILDFTFGLESSLADFTIDNVSINGESEGYQGSASSVSINDHQNAGGDDVLMLEGGYSNIYTGEGVDTLIVTDQVDATTVVVDFDSGSDKFDMSQLLSDAGYTADSLLDGAFGGNFDSETNVLELFVDTDTSDGVSLETYEVTLSEGSEFEDDDLSANFSAFIA